MDRESSTLSKTIQHTLHSLNTEEDIIPTSSDIFKFKTIFKTFF